jgi:hypothetical protein
LSIAALAERRRGARRSPWLPRGPRHGVETVLGLAALTERRRGARRRLWSSRGPRVGPPPRAARAQCARPKEFRRRQRERPGQLAGLRRRRGAVVHEQGEFGGGAGARRRGRRRGNGVAAHRGGPWQSRRGHGAAEKGAAGVGARWHWPIA